MESTAGRSAPHAVTLDPSTLPAHSQHALQHYAIIHLYMEIVWKVPLQRSPKDILLAAGYHKFTDPATKHHSFIHRLGRMYYPRFHIYLTQGRSALTIDLHLDQKKSTAFSTSRHAGEYDGVVVEDEAERLIRWFGHYADSPRPSQ